MLKARGIPVARACGCGMPTPNAVRPFAVDPQDAIDFLRRKINVPTAAWTDLWEAEHSVGFMVAGAMSDDLLRDFREAIDDAIANGTTLDDFRARFDEIVAEHGWSYNGSRGWRSAVIFDTNINTAYAAGKWEQIQRVKEQRPYLRYVHLEGQRNPRPEHEAWHDTVLPVDDPWWLTHYPPNGWNCHCTVQSLNARDLDRYGLTVSEAAPVSPLEPQIVNGRIVMVPRGIDPGFAYRPGEMPDIGE